MIWARERLGSVIALRHAGVLIASAIGSAVACVPTPTSDEPITAMYSPLESDGYLGSLTLATPSRTAEASLGEPQACEGSAPLLLVVHIRVR